MRERKTHQQRHSRKSRVRVEPPRVAAVAMDRIRSLLVRAGRGDRVGAPATMQEIVARAHALGRSLPASYTAALEIATSIGEPEILLGADQMREELKNGARARPPLDVARYVPFCKTESGLVCFDLQSLSEHDGELGVAFWDGISMRERWSHFADWLDSVADRREEEAERAARIPAGLRRLLVALGFSFDDPIALRLETGDVEAIRALIGEETERAVRGDRDRLFDSSGKASLVLSLDDFTLAVSLRTGIFHYEAEDVFRWLRYFRDENFFSDVPKAPSHPDRVRDLRSAPREPPLILRGVTSVIALAARQHVFRAAAGTDPEDFWVLGRTRSTHGNAPSLLVHVAKGVVDHVQQVEQTLGDLHVTPDGTIWGLSPTGHAIRYAGGRGRPFPLDRRTRGRPWWYGIGGDTGRVLAWGAGALLEFDGVEFSPFQPEPELEPSEAVVSLRIEGAVITMLVCGPEMGAVARFDSRKWLPIAEAQVIHEALVDMDVWRDVAVILTRGGEIWRMELGEGATAFTLARPKRVVWDRALDAFVTDAGTPRPLHGIKGFDGGALIASDGGVIRVGSKEPLFFAAPDATAPARVVRLGNEDHFKLVVLCGGCVWTHEKDELVPIDLRAL
jgi:hypothetical protein